LLARVSDALGVMTRHILEQGGVVGDFHGDAAMGFWGWPLADASAAERACQAALGIRANFATNSSCEPKNSSSDTRSSGDFRVGIGIASGRAVAGKIGTIDQVKVTAFGPVVNLASRLEAMTKQFPASILIDGPTARAVRDALSPEICRVRRLARVLPVGLTTAIDIFEILPSESDCPDVPNEGLARYEAALNAFEMGDWEKAKSLLREAPNADRVKGFLLGFMNQQGNAVSAGWDGAIRLSAK
jgi:adenylate cyclase